MPESRPASLIDLPARAEARLITGARDTDPVRGLTHGFYKYPARFSPTFVRAVIETFTRPGDLCLDPHVGGGTTLVEALALGRHGVGVDISALAEFVATVKTTIYEDAEMDQLRSWAKRVQKTMNVHGSSVPFSDYAELGYYKHLDHPSRWRLRKAIEQALGSALRLRSPKLRSFGRCVVLRTAQWALDGRSKATSIKEFRAALQMYAEEMIAGARQLRDLTSRYSRESSIEVFHRSSVGLEFDERLRRWPSPKLVLTSPPYPGVHVLYHRWQVDGRKEAPLPFMIAGKLDGAGSSYYTMGDRHYPELATYFAHIKNSMASVAALADARTTVVQMLAFSEPDWQLPRYLETMRDAGLEEMGLPSLRGEGDGRLWRSVPGRRWYSDQRGQTPGSQEVVLFHRRVDARRTSPLTVRLPSEVSSARSGTTAR